MHLPTFTLLIVEDLATHRELYREHLSHDSHCVYDVLEAESVAGGLELCRSTSVDGFVAAWRDVTDRVAVHFEVLYEPTGMISPNGSAMKNYSARMKN